jgi:hypothetical protein
MQYKLPAADRAADTLTEVLVAVPEIYSMEGNVLAKVAISNLA